MKCCNEWRVRDEKNAVAVCTKCGDCISYQDPAAANAHHEQLHVSTKLQVRYAYKRLTHFRLWLQRVQGLDDICPEAFKKIHRILQAYEPPHTSERIRRVVRECGYNEYYNSTAAVARRMGIPVQTFSANELSGLESMFHDIEESFARMRCYRQNMLSYSFILQRMFELLGITLTFDCIKEMKHPDKIHAADEVWKGICMDLDFPYHATYA